MAVLRAARRSLEVRSIKGSGTTATLTLLAARTLDGAVMAEAVANSS